MSSLLFRMKFILLLYLVKLPDNFVKDMREYASADDYFADAMFDEQENTHILKPWIDIPIFPIGVNLVITQYICPDAPYLQMHSVLFYGKESAAKCSGLLPR